MVFPPTNLPSSFPHPISFRSTPLFLIRKHMDFLCIIRVIIKHNKIKQKQEKKYWNWTKQLNN